MHFYLADLEGMRLGQAPAKDREVLTEDKDGPSIDEATAGDNPCTGETIGISGGLKPTT